MLLAIAGVCVRPISGVRVLRRIPDMILRRGVAILVILLGIYMLGRGYTMTMPPR